MRTMYLYNQRVISYLIAMVVALCFAATSTHAAVKHSLLIGVGTNTGDSGWGKTNAENDVTIFSKTLEAQGFTNNVSLKNEKATKTEVLKQLDNIYKQCAAGDVFLFYFSGHGQLIKDYNADEYDGYDESLVLYGAPKAYDKLYKNEHHLLDEELSEILNNFRIKLAAKGEVIVLVDAGYGWIMDKMFRPFVRGGALPLEANHNMAQLQNIGLYESGILDDLPFSRPSAGHATITQMSATAINSFATEYNGNGIFTLSLSRSFETHTDSTNYFQWFEEVKRQSQILSSRQNPIFQGDADKIMFEHIVATQQAQWNDFNI